MREYNLKHYLLGLLSEPEQTQLELQLLSDDEAYAQLLLAEDDLIEAYLHGELSGLERERFERIFLAHAARKEKLSLTRALMVQANAVAKPALPKLERQEAAPGWAKLWPVGWKLATAAALASLVLIIGLRFIRPTATPGDAPMLAGSPRTSAPVQASPPPVGGTKTLPVELSSGQSMAIGTTLKEITITPEIGQVQLQLWLRKDRWDTYKVSLQPYDLPAKELPGEFKRQTVKGLSYIEVSLPITELPNQEFTLKLEGIMANGERGRADHYNFRVKRR